jgi:hypothetical protein
MMVSGSLKDTGWMPIADLTVFAKAIPAETGTIADNS